MTAIWHGLCATQIVYTGESQSITIDFVNNKDGQATGMATYDGGSLVATTSEGYDSDGNVTSIYTTNAASTVLQDYSYACNTLDQLSAQVQDGVSLNFSYDSSGQLTQATTPGVGPSPYTFDHGYDANPNRDTGGSSRCLRVLAGACHRDFASAGKPKCRKMKSRTAVCGTISASGAGPEPIMTGLSSGSGMLNPWLPFTSDASSGITSTRVRKPSFLSSTLAIARPLGQSNFGSKNNSQGS